MWKSRLGRNPFAVIFRPIGQKRLGEDHIDGAVNLQEQHHDPLDIDLPISRLDKRRIVETNIPCFSNMLVMRQNRIRIDAEIAIANNLARQVDATFNNNIRADQSVLQAKRIMSHLHENDVWQKAAMSTASISSCDGLRRPCRLHPNN